MVCLGVRSGREVQTTRENEGQGNKGEWMVKSLLPLLLFGCLEDPPKSSKLRNMKKNWKVLEEFGGLIKNLHSLPFLSQNSQTRRRL